VSARPSRKKKKKTEQRSFLIKLRENIDALVFALFIAMFFRTFVVELYQVPTGSMTPTLMGDFAARIDLTQSGEDDIVLFEHQVGEGWPLKMVASAPFAVLYHPRTRSFSVQGEMDVSLEQIKEQYAEIFHPVIIQEDEANWELESPFDYLDEIRQIDEVNREYSRLVINKFYYWFREPQIGDVIMFKTPADIYDSSKPKYIKRIAALDAHTLSIQNDRLYLDGERIEEHPILYNNEYFTINRLDDHTVQPDHFYALGDNSSSSFDSRFWGDIPRENIGGKALFCFWPLQNIGFIR